MQLQKTIKLRDNYETLCTYIDFLILEICQKKLKHKQLSKEST